MTSKEAIERLKTIKTGYSDVERWIFNDMGDVFQCLVRDDVEAIDLAIAAIKDLEVCRNELCLRCGQYKQRHLGACDGCRWLPKEET